MDETAARDASEVWRLFVAVELGRQIQARVGHIVDRLSEAGWRARWVKSGSSHLTLKFYGNVERDRLPALRAALMSTARDCEPFELTTGDLGMFPNQRRPRVIWLGLRGDDDRLARLARAVDQASAALGFPPEEREFTPHITLGRVRPEEQKSIAGVDDILPDLRRLPPLALNVERIVLFRSELRREGSIYTIVDEFPLSR